MQANPEFIKDIEQDIERHKNNASIFRKMARDESNWMKEKQRQLLSYQKRYSK